MARTSVPLIRELARLSDEITHAEDAGDRAAIVRRVDDLRARAEAIASELDTLDRNARLGFDAAALVHDLSNVLGGMIGHVQLAGMTGTEEDLRKCVQVLESGLGRAGRMIQAFKARVSKTRTLSMINVKSEVARVLDGLREDFRREDLSWSLSGDAGYMACDRTLFARLLASCVMELASVVPRSSSVAVRLAEEDGGSA
ncbi:MAG: hypothetical protein M5R36_29205 [Deltaproteobacteria bacterium]|nr:hypothetical protein [Deltaproteobacteria bacterium]